MKTAKYFTTIVFILLFTNVYSQYIETFPLAEKGVLAGDCGATSMDCASFDFTEVDWDLVGTFAGLDGGDYLKTNGSGELDYFGDIDGEICFESPLLDISEVAGSFSIEADLVWNNHDQPDWIDMEYSIDGALPYVQVPNQFHNGTPGPHTVHDIVTIGGNWSSSGTIVQGGLSGTSTLRVRICVITNTSSESTFLSEVRVPETGAVVLPVKWAEFTAQSTSKGNQLNWATYTEVNNERFDIEKSGDGTFDFRKIGSVDGAGTSTKTSRYEFLDRNESSAISYYRIKQVDLDGHFEYSEVVMVKNDVKDKIRFTPNPFSTQILISMNQQDLVEGTSIRMFNNQGQLVLEKKITKLNLNDPIDTAKLSAGMYSIQYSNGEVVRLVKF